MDIDILLHMHVHTMYTYYDMCIICVHMHIRDASGDLRSELQNERKLQLMRSELERFVTFFLRLPTTL